MNFLAHKRNKVFSKDTQLDLSEKSPFDNFYYREIAKMTGSGGWSVNFKDKVSYLDAEARRILNTPPNYRPSLKNAMEFYADDHKEKAAATFFECSTGTPFDIIIKMLTYDKKEFWAKAIGKPVKDKDNNVIGMLGVFRDIHTERLKEIAIEKSVKTIESQNSRLFNFAHIVSHNLRSHASNLQLTLELLKTIGNPEEEEELKSSLTHISTSLNGTIAHLSEIVNIQSKAQDEQKEVFFEEVLDNSTKSINRLILNSDAEIYSDFTEVKKIKYIPAYLDSIFLNLMTNSIKYRHPDRSPVIDICTYSENGSNYLMFKDNGLGIDLEKYGGEVFNMYKTFHQNEGARGIGLFITKNQIEALQGSIEIESVVNQGTTFRIRF